MTQENLLEIKNLLANESKKWRLDVGDWIGYVEELVDEVERLQAEVSHWKENYRNYCNC